MFEKQKTVAVLTDVEAPTKHRIQLDRLEPDMAPIDLALNIDHGRHVPAVRDILKARITQSAGTPPDVSDIPAGAHFALPESVNSADNLFWDASNTLRDLQDACQGDTPVEEVLDEYAKRMQSGPEKPGNGTDRF